MKKTLIIQSENEELLQSLVQAIIGKGLVKLSDEAMVDTVTFLIEDLSDVVVFLEGENE